MLSKPAFKFNPELQYEKKVFTHFLKASSLAPLLCEIKISILLDTYWRQLEKKAALIISLHSSENLRYSDFPRYRMLDLSLDLLQPLKKLTRHIHMFQPRLSPSPLYHEQGRLRVCRGSSATPRRQNQPRSCQKCNCYCKTSLRGQRQQIRGRDKIKLEIGFCRVSKLTPRSPVLLFQSHCQGTL